MEEWDEARWTLLGKGPCWVRRGGWYCNPSTLGPRWEDPKLQASLGYAARHCLKYRHTEALPTRIGRRNQRWIWLWKWRCYKETAGVGMDNGGVSMMSKGLKEPKRRLTSSSPQASPAPGFECIPWHCQLSLSSNPQVQGSPLAIFSITPQMIQSLNSVIFTLILSSVGQFAIILSQEPAAVS